MPSHDRKAAQRLLSAASNAADRSRGWEQKEAAGGGNKDLAGDLQRTASVGQSGWEPAWNGREHGWEQRKRRQLVQRLLCRSWAVKGTGEGVIVGTGCGIRGGHLFEQLGKSAGTAYADEN